jgi:tetratricopeptide (TPR) repeat protein
MEALVADEYLAREIEAADGLEVLSCPYAFYLICECYIKLKKKADLLKGLKQFEEFCIQNKNAQSFSLLGYTHMKIHQFKKAGELFKMVQELQPEDKLVKSNIAACEKFDAKNVTDEDLNLEKKLIKLNLWK